MPLLEDSRVLDLYRLIAEVRGTSVYGEEENDETVQEVSKTVGNEDDSQDPANGEQGPPSQYEMKVEESDEEAMIAQEQPKKSVPSEHEKAYKELKSPQRDALIARILHLKEKIALKRICWACNESIV